MKKFSSLLLLELKRVKMPYLVLIGLVIFSQWTAIYAVNQRYLDHLKEFIMTTQGNRMDFLMEVGHLTFYDVAVDELYSASIMGGIFTLLLYALGIWYRDWRGSDPFSARMLLLPGSRFSIFLAKYATILFMIGGLLVVQLVLLVTGERFLGMITPGDLYQSLPLRNILESNVFPLILPSRPLDFILHYSIGAGLLALLFLMVIMWLCFRWKGILIDAAITATLIFFLNGLHQWELLEWLFPHELLLVVIISSVLLIFGATFFSARLLDKEISI